MDDGRSTLGDAASIPGVSIAVMMDRDGFVIDWAGQSGMEAEDVAAVASCLLESSEGVGRDFGQGGLRNVICEFDDGMVAVMCADATTRLAVVLRDPAALGAVRRLAAQVMPVRQRP